jgi:hypothetical protein
MVKVSMKREMLSAGRGQNGRRKYDCMKTGKKVEEESKREEEHRADEQRNVESEGGEKLRTSGRRTRGRDWRSIML